MHPTLGCLLHVLPRVTTSLHFCLGVFAPCVPGSSPLSLPLGIPGQSLSGDAAGRLPEGVANPTPLSAMDLCGHWFLMWCLSQVFVSLLVWPPDTKGFAQTAVDESLELMECWSWWSIVLNILYLVDFPISLELQTLRIRKAVHALPIPALTSAPAPPPPPPLLPLCVNCAA